MAVALVAGGMAGGYFLQNEWSSRRALPTPEVVTLEVPSYQDGVTSRMPDVRGIDEQAARQILIDSGIDARSITVSTEPAAGPAGSVIDQTPASGTDRPASAKLVVSTEARMPAYDGQTGQQMSVTLQKMGAQVDLVNRYQPGAKPGSVVASTPRVGAPLTRDVQLVVAETGSSAYLSSLSSVGGGCSSRSASLNGKDFEKSVRCEAGSRGPDTYEWVTKRAVDQLTATVGIADDATPGTSARVEVFADGRRVAQVVARYGVTAELNAIITNALRVSVVVTQLGPQTDDSVYAVLGDARFVGSADAIKRLEN
ncbi:PASTA domain-containing protein [Gordonia alkanivorans]|uniref:PASTA domain-containing protein n=1 Tax=Gordonia alkanivorans TaxID=84096 RepID=UPI001F4EF85B|nr:PASTA domain-containing protein [Gordonia alkanivorans]